ncbi:MAG: TIM44-like domain-containing protein [Azospirillaceae bacterium]|nr:TIM44-like domain-containing protein [Azospirillaceae bacterium]
MMSKIRLFLPHLLAVALILAPALAEAKAGSGSSFGSRGSRTYMTAPTTPTAPSVAAPIGRSMTQPPLREPLGASPTPGSSFGSSRPFMSGLMGGFLGAGLAGMLFGHGFGGGLGGIASLFGLLIQLAVIVGLVMLVRNWLMSRRGAVAAGFGGPRMTPGGGFGGGSGMPRGAAPPPRRDEVGITGDDLGAFERLLVAIQDSWSRTDLATLRRAVTPEILSYFSELLAQNASEGIENRISNVKLLQGDLAESWNEGNLQYATVAMHWSAIDFMVDRSGRIVGGSNTVPSETTELWTFMRSRGGQWLLSAIQQT